MGKGFLAQVTLVRPDARVRPRMSLEVECVIETLAAECAEVSFDVRVAFHMSVQKSLKAEVLRANSTHKFRRIIFAY